MGNKNPNMHQSIAISAPQIELAPPEGEANHCSIAAFDR